MAMPPPPSILASTATAISYLILHSLCRPKVYTSKLSSSCRYSSGLVNVTVGPSEAQKTYTLLACYLTHRSLYFATAIASAQYTVESSNPGTPSIDLPDCSPATFELYMQLIFTNSLPIQEPAEAAALANGVATAPVIVDGWLANRYSVLIDLYILATTLHDTAAQNAVLSAMVAQSLTSYTINTLFFVTDNGRRHFNTTMRFPSLEDIKRVYEATGPNSGIRRMMVDFWMANREYWAWWIVDAEGSKFHEGFLRDLIQRLASEAGGGRGQSRWTRQGVNMARYYESPMEERRERVDSVMSNGEV